MEYLNKIKRYGPSVAALLMLVATASASDLTRGITFANGQRVTAANLHDLVDTASVGVTFLTGKDPLGTVDSADYVLLYDTSTGTFKKMTLATLLTGNTELITAQSENTDPASNDMLLMYDASGTALVKVSITNLVYHTNLIHTLPTISSNVLGTAKLKLLNGGTNAAATLTDLWYYSFNYTRAFTNQLEHTAPTNTDKLLIWDALAGTNKWMTVIGMNTNLPATTSPTNTATLTLFETGQVKQVSISNLVTSARGLFGPQFIPPVVVYSNTVGASFTTFYATTNGVPTGAAAVILQAYGSSYSGTGEVLLRKQTGGSSYRLLKLKGNGDGIRPDGDTSQGYFPVSATNTFDYSVEASSGYIVVELIGYY